jgi:uncharacterized protein
VAGEPVPSAPQPSQDARNWSMLAHLSALVAIIGIPSFVGPLVVWLIRRDSDPISTEHAREALNFNISVLIYGVVAVILAIVTLGVGLLVVIPLAIVIAILWLVVTIVAAVKASNGEPYRYPITIRLVN